MTLILGIKCQDGIVIGADSETTFATMLSGKTIALASSKLDVFGERVVVGVAGAVGMGQAFRQEISEYIDGRLAGQTWKSIKAARGWLKNELWKHVEPGWQHADSLAKGLPPQLRQSAFVAVETSTVIAFPIGDEPYLLELDHLCEPTECTYDLPFVTIGSGKVHADPFLAFIKRVFWPHNAPTLTDGTFAATWTLQHAIACSPGGVGGPIRLVTLSKTEGRGWRAKELSRDDLGEHLVAIDAVQEEMPKVVAEFFNQRGAAPIPKA
jgi:hypothetical protein